MSLFKFELNKQGVNQLLRGAEATAACKEIADRIAADAGSNLQDPEGMLVVDAPDAKRARSVVVTATPEAMVAEARDRVLTAAFGNARG